MAGIERFEDIRAWQAGRRFVSSTVFRELAAEGESVANQIGAFRADLERRHKLR